MNVITNPKIDAYIKSFIKSDNPLLNKDRFYDQNKTISDIKSFIEPETAKFVNLIIKMLNAKNVLEIGTCVGYSGIWFAEAIKQNNGSLYTIEHDIRLINEANKNIQESGLMDYVKIIHDDACNAVKQFQNNFFDVIFVDLKKSLYIKLYEDCIRLTRSKGIIIADDTLFKPLGVSEKFSQYTDEYNKLVFNDSRLYSSIIPIGEGLTVSIKM